MASSHPQHVPWPVLSPHGVASGDIHAGPGWARDSQLPTNVRVSFLKGPSRLPVGVSLTFTKRLRGPCPRR